MVVLCVCWRLCVWFCGIGVEYGLVGMNDAVRWFFD